MQLTLNFHEAALILIIIYIQIMRKKNISYFVIKKLNLM